MPVFKYYGGKSAEAEEIIPLFLDRGTYWEPFCGSCAVFEALRVQDQKWEYTNRRYVLSDINPFVTSTYQAIQRDSDRVLDALETLIEAHWSKNGYLEVRDIYNEGKHLTEYYWRAAMQIFLNRAAFNGLIRISKKEGNFNVPPGTRVKQGKTRRPPKDEVQRWVHDNALRCPNVEVRQGDFREILLDAHELDTIYLDPPYLDTFNGYSGKDWTVDDFNAVVSVMHMFPNAVLSHSDTPLLRELLPESRFVITPIEVQNTSGGKNASRSPRQDVLVFRRKE